MPDPSWRLLLTLLLALLVSGCTYERHFAPDRSSLPAVYRLAKWPQDSVRVTVDDSRPTRSDDSVRLVEAVRTVVTGALATAEGQRTVAPIELKISVLDHQVVLKGPWWNARTRFRATLLDGSRLVEEWVALGEDRRWNMAPAYFDAMQASQRAFALATEDLMTKLGTASRW